MTNREVSSSALTVQRFATSFLNSGELMTWCAETSALVAFFFRGLVRGVVTFAIDDLSGSYRPSTGSVEQRGGTSFSVSHGFPAGARGLLLVAWFCASAPPDLLRNQELYQTFQRLKGVAAGRK